MFYKRNILKTANAINNLKIPKNPHLQKPK